MKNSEKRALNFVVGIWYVGFYAVIGLAVFVVWKLVQSAQ